MESTERETFRNKTRVRIVKQLVAGNAPPVGTTGTVIATWDGGFSVKWDDYANCLHRHAFDTVTAARNLAIIPGVE